MLQDVHPREVDIWGDFNLLALKNRLYFCTGLYYFYEGLYYIRIELRAAILFIVIRILR